MPPFGTRQNIYLFVCVTVAFMRLQLSNGVHRSKFQRDTAERIIDRTSSMFRKSREYRRDKKESGTPAYRLTPLPHDFARESNRPAAKAKVFHLLRLLCLSDGIPCNTGVTRCFLNTNWSCQVDSSIQAFVTYRLADIAISVSPRWHFHLECHIIFKLHVSEWSVTDSVDQKAFFNPS